MTMKILKNLIGTQLFELQKVSQQINYVEFEKLAKDVGHAINKIKCDVYATGMGKAGHVAKKFAASMSSLGVPTHFVHPGEAHHGDLGMIKPDSVVFCFSNSGKTQEVLSMIEQLKTLHSSCTVVAITQSISSPLGKLAHKGVYYGEVEEACHLKMAPTTSTLTMELIGNTIAVFFSLSKGFSKEDFGARHHGGYLGSIAKKEGE
jgi:arabinose-5-phosphate isomerase